MASVLAKIMKKVMKGMPVTEDVQKEREANASRRPPQAPAGVTVSGAVFGGISCETVRKPQNGQTVMYYIHGGGFTTGSARERRDLTFYLCDEPGYDCISCDYRLAPENKLPAAYEDCFSAYREICARYPKVIVLGESAGGTLALATVQRAMREGLPLPLAVAAFSPLAGLNMDFASHTENVKTDVMLKRDPAAGKLLDMLCPEGYGASFCKDAAVSPYYGEFRGYPPLFLSASDEEILYDDARALYARAQSAKVRCRLEVQKGMMHAWPMFPMLKEARKTLADLKMFLKEAGA